MKNRFRSVAICLVGCLLIAYFVSTACADAEETMIDPSQISVLGINVASATNYAPEKLLDGIVSEKETGFWESKGGYTEAYITFDLSSAASLSSIRIYARQLNGATYGRCVKDYAIYVSYTAPVYSATLKQVPSGLPAAATISGTLESFSADAPSRAITLPAGTEGRYVTIHLKNTQLNTSAQDRFDISEIEFYSAEPTEEATAQVDRSIISITGANAMSQSKYPVTNLLDGVASSKESGFWETSAGYTSAYVTFDMGSSIPLSRILIYARPLNAATYGRCVKDYAVYVSDTEPAYNGFGQVPSQLPAAATAEGTLDPFSSEHPSQTIVLPAGTKGRYVTLYLKNTQLNTEAQNCLNIAEMEFYTIKTKTVADVALEINLIPCPANDATQITLPSAPEGYSISIAESSHPTVVDLSGRITRSNDTTYGVRLTLKVTKDDTGESALTKPLLVPIYKTYVAPTMTQAQVDAAHRAYESKSYGGFFHYISEFGGKGTVYSDGTMVQTVDEAAEAFDAAAFARTMDELGVEYVLFTVWHGDGRTLFPSTTNQRWRDDRRGTGTTAKKSYSDRDVIMDLLDELDKYGIELHLYTHPHDGGYDFTADDQALTGALDSADDYAVWNQYINELYYELCERYGDRIKGLWFDGYGSETGSKANQARLRSTCLSFYPGMILTMNTAYQEGVVNPKTQYTCPDYRAWEISKQGDYINDMKFSRHQSAIEIAKAGWWATKGKDVTIDCNSAEEMFAYLVAMSSISTHGGFVPSTGFYAVREGEVLDNYLMTGIYDQLKRLNDRYLSPVKESILGTANSTAYITTENIDVADLAWGIANESQDGKYIYLHVLNAPAGKTMQLPAAEDGSVLAQDAVIMNFDGTTTPLTIEKTADGYSITLPDDVSWHQVDTVIKAERTSYSHRHCACGGALTHECQETPWILWGNTEAEKTSLPIDNGHYVLVSDIAVSDEYLVPNGNEVYLCLNGHNVTGTDNQVYSASGKLSICDCGDTPGTLTSLSSGVDRSDDSGGTIFVTSTGTLRIYGGIFTAKATVKNGGVLYVSEGGKAYLHGGILENGKATNKGGVIAAEENTHLEISGAIIRGGSSSNGANLCCSGTVIMNNGKIYAPADTNNIVVTSNCVFTMNGGLLEGGRSRNVMIWDSGTFIMNGGSLRTKDYANPGANIRATKGAHITINGGTISGGIASDISVAMEPAADGSVNAKRAASLSICGGNIGSVEIADDHQSYDPQITFSGSPMIGKVVRAKSKDKKPLITFALTAGAQVVFSGESAGDVFGTGSGAEYIWANNGLHAISADDDLLWAQYATDASLKFAAASVSLYADIAVNFKVESSALEGFTDPYVVFDFAGTKQQVRLQEVQDGYAVFRFRDIGPHLMGETITATLYATKDGILCQGETQAYSIAQYCYNTLNRYNTDYYRELHTLLVDLLNYGAMAQLYVNPSTPAEQLVTAGLTQQQKAWGTPTDSNPALMDIRSESALTGATVAWVGGGLSLQESVALRLRFAAESTEGLSVRFTLNGNTFTVTDFVPVEDKSGEFYVYLRDMNASHMRAAVKATVYRDGQPVSNTLTYSVASYIANHANDTDAQLAQLVKAIIRYGDAAHSYVN